MKTSYFPFPLSIIWPLLLALCLDLFNVESSSKIIRVRQHRRQWCRGSRRLEHLRGRCMFHYECVQQSGVSIGHCLNNHLFMGSCCMLPNQYNILIQSKPSSDPFAVVHINRQPSTPHHGGPLQRLIMHYNQHVNEIQSKQNFLVDVGKNGHSSPTSQSISQGNNFVMMKMDPGASSASPTATTITTQANILPAMTTTITNNIQNRMTDDADDDHEQNDQTTAKVSTILTECSDDDDAGVMVDPEADDDQNPINSLAFDSNVLTSTDATTNIGFYSEQQPQPDQESCDLDPANQITTTSKMDNPLLILPGNDLTTADDDDIDDKLDPNLNSIMNTNWPSPTATQTTTSPMWSNAASTPKPIQVNQNEFYEIVVNPSSSTTTKTPPPSPTTESNYVNDSSPTPFTPTPVVTSPAAPISATTTRSNKFHSSFLHSRMCGIRPLRPTGRVVGGRNAQFGEWPWQVLIKEKSWLGFFSKSKCGGVLIDYKWILTAAHCQPGMMGSLIVMLGQHELHGASQSLRPVVKTVRRMIVHRDFDPDTFDNDIALLELDTPFEMQPHIVPICLPTQDDDYVGEFAYVAGWGKLSYGGSIPSILQTVRLPIIDNPLCQKMFTDAGHYKYIRDRFLCAGYSQGGRDTCEGDSGGPLMMKKDDVWTLIGTVSHGIKCAEPNLPGVYMKTWSYLPWIRGIIERNP